MFAIENFNNKPKKKTMILHIEKAYVKEDKNSNYRFYT
jgi:hypothetical protein